MTLTRTMSSTARAVAAPAAALAVLMLPAAAHAEVYAAVEPTGDGVAVRAGAGVAVGGAHQSATLGTGGTGSRTCAGALLAGGCAGTSGSDASGFVNADLLLYGGSVTYTVQDGRVVVCSGVVYGVCTS